MRALLYHLFPDTRIEARYEGEIDYLLPVPPLSQSRAHQRLRRSRISPNTPVAHGRGCAIASRPVVATKSHGQRIS
jgi:hypothetical protein